MNGDVLEIGTIGPGITVISDPVAFQHLGLDPAGNMTYTGNNQFNYFASDYDTNESAMPQHFNDPELRKKLGLPDPEDGEEEDNTPPTPTWTTTPREMVRASSDPIVLSTTPDVAKTPVGSSTPPIPYSTWADPVDDSGYASSVFATQNQVMTMDSAITVTQGAEQGTATGVKSGTINGVTEPQQHSSNVRAEGAYVIRHLDRAMMNNGNNIGEFVYVEDVTTHAIETEDPPEEEPGFWGNLWQGAKDINEEYKLTQRGVGVLQTVGGGLEVVAGGVVVAASGVGTVFSGGTAAPLTVVTAVGGGALAVKGTDDLWAGLQTIWTGDIHDTVLDDVVAGAAESLGASEGVTTVLQAAAGAVGNPANILKEGGERVAREAAEEAAERAAREAAEEASERAARESAEEASEATARRNARVSQNCYAAALAAMIIARAAGEPYVGGPHGTPMNGGASGPVGDGLDSHHTPPNSVNRLSLARGPAIQMDPNDHYLTASNGKTVGYKLYNTEQGRLIRTGRTGFMSAIRRDIVDVRRIAAAQGNPTKYDKALAMMFTYATCLAGSGALD